MGLKQWTKQQKVQRRELGVQHYLSLSLGKLVGEHYKVNCLIEKN